MTTYHNFTDEHVPEPMPHHTTVQTLRLEALVELRAIADANGWVEILHTVIDELNHRAVARVDHESR